MDYKPSIIEINELIGADCVTDETNDFITTAIQCCILYAKKNHDYGNSFNDSMNKIGNAYALGRLHDKINRLIALSKTKSKVNDESIIDTLKDLACYSIMTINYLNKNNTNIEIGVRGVM